MNESIARPACCCLLQTNDASCLQHASPCTRPHAHVSRTIIHLSHFQESRIATFTATLHLAYPIPSYTPLHPLTHTQPSSVFLLGHNTEKQIESLHGLPLSGLWPDRQSHTKPRANDKPSCNMGARCCEVEVNEVVQGEGELTVKGGARKTEEFGSGNLKIPRASCLDPFPFSRAHHEEICLPTRSMAPTHTH